MKYTIVGLIFFGLLGISFNYTIVEKTNTDAIYPYRMKLYYTRIDGLREGTEVSVKGVDFGLVQEIKKVSVEDVPDPGNFQDDKSTFIKPAYLKDGNIPYHSPSGKYYDDFFIASHNTLEENRPDIRRTIINLRELSVKLKSDKGTLPLLTNTEIVYNGLLDTTADARIILKEFRRYEEGIRETDTVFIPFSLVLYRQLVGSIYGNQY